MDLFWIWASKIVKDISILALVAILISEVELFGQFWLRALWAHLCEIILNLGKQFRRCHIKIFFSFVSAILVECKLF